MKKRNTLVKKIAAALLASLFYTDTILLAPLPFCQTQKLHLTASPSCRKRRAAFLLSILPHLQLAESLAMTMSDSTCPKKGPF